jgi:hypothetical protein
VGTPALDRSCSTASHTHQCNFKLNLEETASTFQDKTITTLFCSKLRRESVRSLTDSGGIVTDSSCGLSIAGFSIFPAVIVLTGHSSRVHDIHNTKNKIRILTGNLACSDNESSHDQRLQLGQAGIQMLRKHFTAGLRWGPIRFPAQ